MLGEASFGENHDGNVSLDNRTNTFEYYMCNPSLSYNIAKYVEIDMNEKYHMVAPGVLNLTLISGSTETKFSFATVPYNEL